MSELQKEFSVRFNTLIELKDPEKFFLTFVEFLRFVQETPPLPSIARRIFSDGLSLEVGRFYKTLQNAPFVEAKMVWADTHRQVLGLQREYDTGFFGFMMSMPLVRAQVRSFQKRMEDGLRHWSVRNKTKVTISKEDTTISLFDDPKRCYSIKSRGKYARKEVPQRFQIILSFPKNGAGISAERLMNKLKKKDIPSVRKEIREINRNFASKVNKEGKLIVDSGVGGRKIYSLNNETYDFEYK